MALDRITAYDIKANILRLLSSRGWSQSELGRRCGLPPSRINEILSSRYDPRVGTLKKIANAFGEPLISIICHAEQTVEENSKTRD